MSGTDIRIDVLGLDALHERAAALIVRHLSEAIEDRGQAVLVASAGRTPTATYRLLCRAHRRALDWRRVHVVQMDEYLGVGCTDARSFAHYLANELVGPLGIGRFTHFNDPAGALIRPLQAYEAEIGTIDLAVHGIGRNGHIGFNEPGSRIDSPCRRVHLTRTTLRANFADEGERSRYSQGVTLGLRILRTARHSLLLATGGEKTGALRRTFIAPPSSRCPASRLRGCGTLTVLADPVAASELTAAMTPRTLPRAGSPPERVGVAGSVASQSARWPGEVSSRSAARPRTAPTRRRQTPG